MEVSTEEGEANEVKKYIIITGNWKIVALGPVAMLTSLAMTLTSEATKTIGMDKICRTRMFLGRLCDDLRDQYQIHFVFDRLVRESFAEHLIWTSVVQSLVACVVLAFLGGWSDRTGRRKVILLLPIIGMSLQIIHSFFNILLLFELPVEYFLFFDAVFGSIVGASVVFLGLFTYEFDNTTTENRLQRFGAIILSALAGVSPGLLLHRLLMRNIGYFGVYVFACIANVINYMYITNHLEEPPRTNEQTQYDGKSYVESFRTFFDHSSIKETIAVVRKNTSDGSSVHMYVILVTMFILFISVSGEQAVFDFIAIYYYYWNPATLRVFRFVSLVIAILGIWMSTCLIHKRWKCHDAVIGIVSSVSKIISSIFFCFGTISILFYIGLAADIFNGTALLATICMYSKLFERNEIGKVNSLVGFLESAARLLHVPLYSFIYMQTRVPMPGAVYLVGAGVTLPVLFIFIWILRRERKKEQHLETSDPVSFSI